ncbi:hypothetical protein L1987_70950 [Smallanthus sonchifolius]|uniref:Uncharacterized protein n=1 Tax=Smallanthus sonchifolius TaxID=185202 RepID=A0ACB9AQ80_9ASTR|nr:hypothetical protein L1987_70950 [Smallanthus sonchifolius]
MKGIASGEAVGVAAVVRGSRSGGGSDWLIGERQSSRSPSFGTRGSGSLSRIRDSTNPELSVNCLTRDFEVSEKRNCQLIW